MADPEMSRPDVATCVFDALKALVAKEPEVLGCAYEHAPTDAAGLPCMIMQTLDGAPIERRYLDGGQVANYRFALLLRRQAAEDQDRLDARAALERVASSLAAASFELGEGRASWGMTLDTLPYRAQSSGEYADWQAELTLHYQTNR